MDGRKFVWDVKRLIRLVADFPIVEVSLDEIDELDQSFWFADANHPATVRQVADHAKLIDETDLKYPIILSSDGGVVDGMHRVAKAYLLGRSTIKAARFETDPEPDYIDVDLDDLPY